MSTAAGFVSIGDFPFCLSASGPSGITQGFGPAAYVNGLTLAQVMQFYWNLETFTITTTGSISETFPLPSGTVYTGTANGSFTFSPVSFSGDMSPMTFIGSNRNVAMPPSGGVVSLGQVCLPPRSRVCYPSGSYSPETPPWCNFITSSSSSPSFPYMDLEFGIEIDATDPTKYAIRYGIIIGYAVTNAGTVFDHIVFTHISPSASSLLASGTFTIAGISFPWYAYWGYAPNIGMSSSGIGLSATSSNFTY